MCQQPLLVGTNTVTHRSLTNIIVNSDFLFTSIISSAISDNSPHPHTILVMPVLYVLPYRNLSIWLQDLPYKVRSFSFSFFNSFLCQSSIFSLPLLFPLFCSISLKHERIMITKSYLVIYHSSSSFSSIIMTEGCEVIQEGCMFRKKFNFELSFTIEAWKVIVCVLSIQSGMTQPAELLQSQYHWNREYLASFGHFGTVSTTVLSYFSFVVGFFFETMNLLLSGSH